MSSAKPKTEKSHVIEDLIEVMRALRTPETGCPWDLEQDFKSIAPYTIEEAYEVADAIERGDMKDLREELGDLLLQPIYHAQMASEEQAFDIYDVIRDVTQKMISRHPHVFGDVQAEKAEDVNKIWDQKKAQEKQSDSALDGVAHALPALLRAQKLQKKAAKTGFEWKTATEVLDKLEEEIKEMREAIEKEEFNAQEDELGDVLFVLVNLARVLDIDAETALRRGNDKFERRFRGIETDCKDARREMRDISLGELIDLWKEQKAKGL